jgi:hypothetical protein
MAFTPDNLSVIVQPIGGTGIRFLSYRSDDSAATITGSGYFTRALSFGVRKYDLIFVSPIAGSVESYIVIVTDINATTGNGTAVLEPAIADGSIDYAKLTPAIAALIQNALQPSAIGSTVQGFSANLTTLASVTPGALGLALLDDANAGAGLATLGVSAYIQTLLDDANAIAAQATLGLTPGLAGYLFGLTFSNNVADATNDFDTAVGTAASDGASPVLMTLASALTKRTDAAWAVGNNQGCWLDGASMPDGTGHVFLMQRSDTGVIDIGASASLSPTLPTNYDRKRRIYSILRESGVVIPLQQQGNTFRRILFTSYASTATYASQLTTFQVPTGIVVQPMLSGYIAPAASSNIYIAVGSAAAGSADVVVQQARTDAGGVTENRSFVNGGFFTNTSRQLYFQHNIISGTASTNTIVQTMGWIDDRGRTA